ncbi:hypothetical protein BKA62DRAFT_672944 [Auriculariales sp. MPI-PUGE-AT-0066]|nr:hypothetical protein BKA62DRAFT_672944 [Auriculariales sp. MPI-PUGE-AT-0066]
MQQMNVALLGLASNLAARKRAFICPCELSRSVGLGLGEKGGNMRHWLSLRLHPNQQDQSRRRTKGITRGNVAQAVFAIGPRSSGSEKLAVHAACASQFRDPGVIARKRLSRASPEHSGEQNSQAGMTDAHGAGNWGKTVVPAATNH